MIWTVSLLATVGALWFWAKREKLQAGLSNSGETRFQLTGELLDGKWKPVRGHRANGIDNKQELRRAVRLSGYRYSSIQLIYWRKSISSNLTLNYENRDAWRQTIRSMRVRVPSYLRISYCTLQTMNFGKFSRAIERENVVFQSHDFLVLCTFSLV